jgi:hypothetical protein
MTEEKALTRNRSIGSRVLAAASDRDAALWMLESTSDLIAESSATNSRAVSVGGSAQIDYSVCA